MFVVQMKAGARFGRVTVYHVKNVTSCLVTGRHLTQVARSADGRNAAVTEPHSFYSHLRARVFGWYLTMTWNMEQSIFMRSLYLGKFARVNHCSVSDEIVSQSQLLLATGGLAGHFSESCVSWMLLSPTSVDAELRRVQGLVLYHIDVKQGYYSS